MQWVNLVTFLCGLDMLLRPFRHLLVLAIGLAVIAAIWRIGRKINKLPALLALLLTFPAVSRAGWGAVSVPVGTQAVDSKPCYEWRSHGDHKLLYRDGVQIGGWRESSQEYRPYDSATGVWGLPCQPPWLMPNASGDPFATGPGLPTGVVHEKLSQAPTIWHGAQHYAAEAVGGSSEVPDLSKKPYLTVISADASKRLEIYKALSSSPLAHKFRVLARPPDHWQLQGHKLQEDTEFKRSGLLVISQEPPPEPGGFGKVLGRAYDFAGIEDLTRKVDPNYNPNGGGSAAGQGFPWFLAVLALGLTLLPPRRLETDDDV